MQHALWKLTALAGIVGIGLLVVLQAQRGLNPTKPEGETGDKAPITASLGEPAPAPGSTSSSAKTADQFGPEVFTDNSEPTPAGVSLVIVLER